MKNIFDRLTALEKDMAKNRPRIIAYMQDGGKLYVNPVDAIQMMQVIPSTVKRFEDCADGAHNGEFINLLNALIDETEVTEIEQKAE